jgi:hypothetical protein
VFFKYKSAVCAVGVMQCLEREVGLGCLSLVMS